MYIYVYVYVYESVHVYVNVYVRPNQNTNLNSMYIQGQQQRKRFNTTNQQTIANKTPIQITGWPAGAEDVKSLSPEKLNIQKSIAYAILFSIFHLSGVRICYPQPCLAGQPARVENNTSLLPDK